MSIYIFYYVIIRLCEKVNAYIWNHQELYKEKITILDFMLSEDLWV